MDAGDVAPRACGGSGRSSPSGADCANGSGCVAIMLDEERVDMLADGSDFVDVLALPTPPFPLYAGNEVHAGDINARDAAAAAVALPVAATEAVVGAGSAGPQPDGHQQSPPQPPHQQPPSFWGRASGAVLWLDYSGQREVGGSPSMLDVLLGELGPLRTRSYGGPQQCWADVVLVLDLQVRGEGEGGDRKGSDRRTVRIATGGSESWTVSRRHRLTLTWILHPACTCCCCCQSNCICLACSTWCP